MKRIIAGTVAGLALAASLTVPALASADEPTLVDSDVFQKMTEQKEETPTIDDSVIGKLPLLEVDDGDDGRIQERPGGGETRDPCDYQHLEVVQQWIAAGRLVCDEPEDHPDPYDDPDDSSTWVTTASPRFTG